MGESIEWILNLQFILCHQAIASIKLFSKLQDEFLKLYDKQNNPIILYAKNGNVYVPPCVVIPEITIISNTSNCFDNVPVQFSYNNITINWFLKDYNILSKTSTLVSCEKINSVLIIDSNNIQIKRINKINSVVTTNQDNLVKLNLFHSEFNYNFHHKQDILDSIDLRRSEEQYIHVNEYPGLFIISSSSENSESLLQIPAEKFKAVANKIANKAKNFFKTIKTIIVSLFFSLLVIGFLYLLWRFRKPILQLYLCLKILIIQFLNRHKRKLQTNTENIHTPIPLQT